MRKRGRSGAERGEITFIYLKHKISRGVKGGGVGGREGESCIHIFEHTKFQVSKFCF